MLFLIFFIAVNAQYNYLNMGVDWTEGKCAYGLAQTPIDIPTSYSSPSPNREHLVYTRDVWAEIETTNLEGYTVESKDTTVQVGLGGS